MNNNDSSFDSWLCGFLDGEGCFGLTLSANGRVYSARSHVTLRADDWRILAECRDRTNSGTLLYRDGKAGSRPQVTWFVLRAQDCLALGERLLAAGGLRAKKARDFSIWMEAVRLICEKGGGVDADHSSRLRDLKEQLHRIKDWNTDTAKGAESLLGIRGLKQPQNPNRRRRNKVSADEAQKMVELYDGGEGQQVIADLFGVQKMLVSRVVNGQYLDVPASQKAKKRMTLPQIEEIASRYRSGESLSALAEEFGIARLSAWRYATGRYDQRYFRSV